MADFLEGFMGGFWEGFGFMIILYALVFYVLPIILRWFGVSEDDIQNITWVVLVGGFMAYLFI